MTKEDLLITIGNNLKTHRQIRRMTQEELAERVGISTSFCANIEGGKKGVSVYTLRDFADALGVTANDLLYESSPNQRIDNIVVLLRTKPDSFLNLLEKVLSLSDEDLLGSACITDR